MGVLLLFLKYPSTSRVLLSFLKYLSTSRVLLSIRSITTIPKVPLQYHLLRCTVQARVPTPAREAQEATASSRPTSTEIASEIEGFEDDFKVCTQVS